MEVIIRLGRIILIGRKINGRATAPAANHLGSQRILIEWASDGKASQ